MECKKCRSINSLLAEGKFKEAHQYIGDNLFSFTHKKVSFSESGHLLACKSCFNIYESKIISNEDFSDTFLFKKTKITNKEQLKSLSYSYSLWNLLESVKRNFENRDSVFVYTFSNDGFTNNSNFNLETSPIFDLKEFGLNVEGNRSNYKFFYSFDDVLHSLSSLDNKNLSSTILLRVELNPKFIEYKIDFSNFPKCYPYLSYDAELEPSKFTVIDYNGVTISNLTDFSVSEHLEELPSFYSNALRLAIIKAKVSYKGEEFTYLDDSELYFNELVEKNK